MKVLNQYPTHHYFHEWNKTDFFCMNCGQKEVWAEECGDYYQGEAHLCISCEHSWNMPYSPDIGDHVKFIGQLKSGITETPDTRKGN